MIKKCTTISLAISLGVVLLTANGLAAAVTKLHDIRAGRHNGYTRFVLEAEGARPLTIGPANAESVTIVYEQLELMRTPTSLFRDMIGAVAKVSHHRQTDRSVIAITFKEPDTAVRTFYLGGRSTEKDTYRLILDLYPPGSAAAGPGELVPVASAKAAIPAPTAAPAPAAAPSPQAAPETSETLSPAAEFSQQLEEVLPKDLKAGSAAQTARVEIASEEQEQWVHPAESPPGARVEGQNNDFLNTPPPEKASQAGPSEQPSIRNEIWGEIDTSIAVSKTDVSMVEKPAPVLTTRPLRPGIKSNALGAVEKASSAVAIQGDIIPHFKILPDKKKESGIVGQRKPFGIKDRTVSMSTAVEENAIQREAVSYESRGPIYKQETIGLVELTLKLLSIALSVLVILFLHRANKIATNRNNALIQLQHSLSTRQHR